MANVRRKTNRILTLSVTQLRRYTDKHLRDIEPYFNPTGVLLTDTSNPLTKRRVTESFETPVIDPS